jgi:hypothetical protein
MIFRNIYLAVLAIFIAHSGVSADTCQFTFKCQGSICERVQPLACSPNASNSAVVITSPSAASSLGAASYSPVTPFVARSTEVVKSQDNLQSTPILQSTPNLQSTPHLQSNPNLPLLPV